MIVKSNNVRKIGINRKGYKTLRWYAWKENRIYYRPVNVGIYSWENKNNSLQRYFLVIIE